jgi:hypothetical protein
VSAPYADIVCHRGLRVARRPSPPSGMRRETLGDTSSQQSPVLNLWPTWWTLFSQGAETVSRDICRLAAA